VTVVREDWLGALQALRGGDGGDIYLCGGGTFAGFVAGHGLLDVLRVKLAPVALGRGIPIFSGLPRSLRMRLIDTRTHGSGVLGARSLGRGLPVRAFCYPPLPVSARTPRLLDPNVPTPILDTPMAALSAPPASRLV
jgi:hypothetical protein